MGRFQNSLVCKTQDAKDSAAFERKCEKTGYVSKFYTFFFHSACLILSFLHSLKTNQAFIGFLLL